MPKLKTFEQPEALDHPSAGENLNMFVNAFRKKVPTLLTVALIVLI